MESHQNKSMKYRRRTEISASILQSAINGATKTRITHESFLSFSQTNYYLHYLIGGKLIKHNKRTNYTTTEKGIKFLRAYSKISGLLSDKESKTVRID
jgi:predicted transcriptional regulator